VLDLGRERQAGGRAELLQALGNHQGGFCIMVGKCLGGLGCGCMKLPKLAGRVLHHGWKVPWRPGLWPHEAFKAH
jgi:hypothetical protein